MKINIKIFSACLLFGMSCHLFAQDIAGMWQQIDDQTGSPKAIIDIRKEPNNTYTGKIIKITPRVGYTPRTLCNNCPAPFTNQPILGMEIFSGLKHENDSKNYDSGKIIDPLSGKVYNLKMKVSASNKRLTMRAYVGVSVFGRNQTWIRLE